MGIGQELLNVPMGDMIREMAFAIADGQTKLDANSINTAEMMGGLTTVYDEEGNVTFDDSRVFFGYEYMTPKEAMAYAIMDDAVSGNVKPDQTGVMIDMMKKVITEVGGQVSDDGNHDVTMPNGKEDIEIRVPVRHSMMELGFAPTFYQFVDTIIEVKIAIKITRERSYEHKSQVNTKGNKKTTSVTGKFFTKGGISISKDKTVTTSQVDATYASKYSYTAEGASILRTKLVPVPVPAVLEERIQSFMQTEEARRTAALEKRQQSQNPSTPSNPS
ncbi:hypothetical protein SAMN05877809_101116 [Rhodobacter sp. JA431]|uniref:hypothetical protein n=1 Tax=Rhodobacter sp. JA431 TaxID=570013 RepID=UPI000BD7F3E3|nr:hypothetical protein [Rhodobacter sp. JA431]SOB90042.1 hypothetical protein SAMN05877809_101116 [Rhodobacter sp. JA431]